ncbi:MAG: hypothetical protein K0S79_892 [Nitrospira sp.]|jgi:hypothetical protein|nr:hypothetical protein [Nitrospira sp.]
MRECRQRTVKAHDRRLLRGWKRDGSRAMAGITPVMQDCLAIAIPKIKLSSKSVDMEPKYSLQSLPSL